MCKKYWCIKYNKICPYHSTEVAIAFCFKWADAEVNLICGNQVDYKFGKGNYERAKKKKISK